MTGARLCRALVTSATKRSGCVVRTRRRGAPSAAQIFPAAVLGGEEPAVRDVDRVAPMRTGTIASATQRALNPTMSSTPATAGILENADGGRMRMHDLAARVVLSRYNVTRLADRMERRPDQARALRGGLPRRVLCSGLPGPGAAPAHVARVQGTD